MKADRLFEQFKDVELPQSTRTSMLIESGKQIEKWGIQSHALFEWLAYLTEEVGELSEAISEYIYRDGDLVEIMKEAIQSATLAAKIAAMIRDKILTMEETGGD